LNAVTSRLDLREGEIDLSDNTSDVESLGVWQYAKYTLVIKHARTGYSADLTSNTAVLHGVEALADPVQTIVVVVAPRQRSRHDGGGKESAGEEEVGEDHVELFVRVCSSGGFVAVVVGRESCCGCCDVVLMSASRNPPTLALYRPFSRINADWSAVWRTLLSRQ
jgi:hypothetical protein